MAAEERKLAKQLKKLYGYEPTQRSEDSIQRAITRGRVERQESYFLLITS
jgi:hypothetical protein